MSRKYTTTVAVSPKTLKRIQAYCKKQGLHKGQFIEDAVNDKLKGANVAVNILIRHVDVLLRQTELNKKEGNRQLVVTELVNNEPNNYVMIAMSLEEFTKHWNCGNPTSKEGK